MSHAFSCMQLAFIDLKDVIKSEWINIVGKYIAAAANECVNVTHNVKTHRDYSERIIDTNEF